MPFRTAKSAFVPLLIVAALLLAPLFLVVAGDINQTLAQQTSLTREIAATEVILAQHTALSAVQTMREALVECTADFAIADARQRVGNAFDRLRTIEGMPHSSLLLGPSAIPTRLEVERALAEPHVHAAVFDRAVVGLLSAIGVTADRGGLQYEGPLSDALDYRVAFAT